MCLRAGAASAVGLSCLVAVAIGIACSPRVAACVELSDVVVAELECPSAVKDVDVIFSNSNGDFFFPFLACDSFLFFIIRHK